MDNKFERRCIGCRQVKLKQEMLKISRINNEYLIDESYKLNGRSAYICKNNECISKAIEKKLLNRAFKTNLDEIYNKLRGYIE